MRPETTALCAYGAFALSLEARRGPRAYSTLLAALLATRRKFGYLWFHRLGDVHGNHVAELSALMRDGYPTVRRALARSDVFRRLNALHDPAFPEVSSPNNMGKMGCWVVISKYTGEPARQVRPSDSQRGVHGEVRRIFKTPASPGRWASWAKSDDRRTAAPRYTWLAMAWTWWTAAWIS
jgi:hypothetical protein